MDFNYDQVGQNNLSTKLCCICRNSERKATKSIYSKGRLQGYNECCTIADIIFELTNTKYIQNQNDDNLICGECIFYVTKYYVLQQNCLRIHKKVENSLNNTENDNSIKYCRCCGKESEEKYYNIMVNLKTINDILNDLINIEINETNDLNTLICQKCDKKLISFEKFRKLLEYNFNQIQDSSLVNEVLDGDNKIEENIETLNEYAEEKSSENCETDLKKNGITESLKEMNMFLQNMQENPKKITELNYIIDDIAEDHNYVEKSKNEDSKEIDAAKKLLNRLTYKPRKKTSEIDKNRVHKIQCKLCMKILADKRSFRQHLETHSAEPSFECNDCKQKFYTQKLLESHRKKKHTNEIYNCSLCNRKYLQLNSLRVHVKFAHLGEELPFTCDVCGKKSATKGMLERHRLIHFDTYNYSCKHCSKKFKLKGILKKHLEIHEKDREQLYCNWCPKSFTNLFALNRHEKRHQEISSEISENTTKKKTKDNKKYSCYLCKDKLRDFKHYEQHFKIFHMHYIEDFKSRRNELINLEI